MAIKFYGGHQLNSKAKVYGTRQDFEVIEVDENGDPITDPSSVEPAEPLEMAFLFNSNRNSENGMGFDADVGDFGSDNFMIDFWAYQNNNGSSGEHKVLSMRNSYVSPSQAGAHWSIERRNGNMQFIYYNSSGSNTQVSWPYAQNNKWNHFSVIRSGDVLTLTKYTVEDGESSVTHTLPSDFEFNPVTQTYFSGLALGGGYSKYNGNWETNSSFGGFSGLLADVRIVKGNSVPYSPPIGVAEAITGTSLLTLQNSTDSVVGPTPTTLGQEGLPESNTTGSGVAVSSSDWANNIPDIGPDPRYYKTLATQYVPPPPMVVGWSYAGLSESERVAPASNGMQLYRHDQPYTNAHSNRTLHNLPEYLEGLPFTVESASYFAENGIQGTPNAFEEYTFDTSGTLYLILRADWGGHNPSTLELQLKSQIYDSVSSTGVLDPSTWTCVEDSVGYMGGGGDYGTYVFSKSVESGTHSLNNLYYYAFKADPAPESAPAPEPAPSANWVVVGSYYDDDSGTNSGSAYVYDANDLSAQPTKLTAFDGAELDEFGVSVAATADKIFVCASRDDDNGNDSGSVYVYDANDLSAQPTKLTAFDGDAGDRFGFPVASVGDKIMVSAYTDDDSGTNSGSVYVYDANDLSAQPTKLTAFDGDHVDYFGAAVTYTGDKIVVGSYLDDDNGENSGSVYVYDANDLSAQPTKLTPFDAAATDLYGYSVAATADKIVVGSILDDDSGTNSGSVYVYDANDLSAQPTKLTAFDGAGDDQFGNSVAATADKIVVAARYDTFDSLGYAGSVYVYDANDLSAQPTKLTAFDAAEGDQFGNKISAIADKIVVSSHNNDDNGSNSGSVYVYDANDLSAQPIKLTAFDGDAGDRFGYSVAIG